jgi:hypothetical protein
MISRLYRRYAIEIRSRMRRRKQESAYSTKNTSYGFIRKHANYILFFVQKVKLNCNFVLPQRFLKELAIRPNRRFLREFSEVAGMAVGD